MLIPSSLLYSQCALIIVLRHQHTQLHRDLVSTVFEIGLRHATPNSIVELMTPNLDITNERVKSHLQSYRLNSGKSRKEFQSKFNGIYCSINARDEESKTAPSVCSTINEDNHVEKIYLPRLTAEEKDTPLGQAFGQVVGLMQNLTVQLEANRQREARESRAHTQAISSQDRPSPHNLTPLRLPSDTSTTQQSVRRQTIESVNPYEPRSYYMTLQQASSLTFPHHGYATQSHSYCQHFPQHSEDNNFALFCEATREEEGAAQFQVTPW